MASKLKGFLSEAIGKQQPPREYGGSSALDQFRVTVQNAVSNSSGGQGSSVSNSVANRCAGALSAGDSSPPAPAAAAATPRLPRLRALTALLCSAGSARLPAFPAPTPCAPTSRSDSGCTAVPAASQRVSARASADPPLPPMRRALSGRAAEHHQPMQTTPFYYAHTPGTHRHRAQPDGHAAVVDGPRRRVRGALHHWQPGLDLRHRVRLISIPTPPLPSGIWRHAPLLLAQRLLWEVHYHVYIYIYIYLY